MHFLLRSETGSDEKCIYSNILILVIDSETCFRSELVTEVPEMSLELPLVKDSWSFWNIIYMPENVFSSLMQLWMFLFYAMHQTRNSEQWQKNDAHEAQISVFMYPTQLDSYSSQLKYVAKLNFIWFLFSIICTSYNGNC